MFCRARVNVAVRCALSRSFAASSGEHRVVVHKGVDELRRGRRDRACLQRAVVEVVGAPSPHRLRVGVREFGLPDQNLGGHRAHGAELAVLALRDGAGDLEPLTDVAVLPDPLPHLCRGPVDHDLHRERDVGRGGHYGRVRRGSRWGRSRRRLRRHRLREHHGQRATGHARSKSFDHVVSPRMTATLSSSSSR